jgi:hypothetical protein
MLREYQRLDSKVDCEAPCVRTGSATAYSEITPDKSDVGSGYALFYRAHSIRAREPGDFVTMEKP